MSGTVTTFPSSWPTPAFLRPCPWPDVNIRSSLPTRISSNVTIGDTRVRILKKKKFFNVKIRCIYSLICPVETCNLRVACKNILESFGLTMDDDGSSVYYGKRLIFLRESMFLRLESARRRYRAECVKKIESFWIKHSKYLFALIKEFISPLRRS